MSKPKIFLYKIVDPDNFEQQLVSEIIVEKDGDIVFAVKKKLICEDFLVVGAQQLVELSFLFLALALACKSKVDWESAEELLDSFDISVPKQLRNLVANETP